MTKSTMTKTISNYLITTPLGLSGSNPTKASWLLNSIRRPSSAKTQPMRQWPKWPPWTLQSGSPQTMEWMRCWRGSDSSRRMSKWRDWPVLVRIRSGAVPTLSPILPRREGWVHRLARRSNLPHPVSKRARSWQKLIITNTVIKTGCSRPGATFHPSSGCAVATLWRWRTWWNSRHLKSSHSSANISKISSKLESQIGCHRWVTSGSRCSCRI